jgi:hypothetical protein
VEPTLEIVVALMDCLPSAPLLGLLGVDPLVRQGCFMEGEENAPPVGLAIPFEMMHPG